MTEHEFRMTEELQTAQDISNVILSLNDLLSEVGGDDKVDNEASKSMLYLFKLLRRKIKYQASISTKYTKRQGLFSRLRDKKIERQEEALELAKEIAKTQSQSPIKALESSNQPQLDYTPENKRKGLILKIKAMLTRNKEQKAIGAEPTSPAPEDNSLSKAPPTAEKKDLTGSNTSESAIEGEVVEDDVSKEETSADESDDEVLNF